MNYRAIRELTHKYNIDNKTFFDVGCASGVTLFTALTVGYQNAHGCEINHALFEFGEILGEVAMEKTGGEYQYFNGDFSKLPLKQNYYSFVTMNSVLEHTPDIELTISRAADILAPGGVCYIFQNAYPSLIFMLTEPIIKMRD